MFKKKKVEEPKKVVVKEEPVKSEPTKEEVLKKLTQSNVR